MNFLTNFRDPTMLSSLIRAIKATLAQIEPEKKPLQIMEVCGGHTHTLFKYGLLQLLPNEIEFIHGPGCPVCVLPSTRIAQCIELAKQPNVILTTFGDAMRVPSSMGSLYDARADGCDVRIVYSPSDALRLATDHPDKQVIFFALGFETTLPATAITLQQAKRYSVENLTVFCQHITLMPTLKTLLNRNDIAIDGFLLPGHLIMITGTPPFLSLIDDYHKPSVVTGFEPSDMLQALLMLLRQFIEDKCELENQYSRVVETHGRQTALKAIDEVFTAQGSCEWRGIGVIENSRIQLSQQYANFDAEQRFKTSNFNDSDIVESRCGDVLSGRCKPNLCGLFANKCTPSHPISALMVSSEGACAAYYAYQPDASGYHGDYK
ncbi:hydrogenase formation protein HypD [Vibrio sonorensis]|uniref:hydrogenase formation protein HypD n=1 Tax=Vibrio sonorensis TaxID=1004316 RepID=UPI0008DA0E0D|nr:hydrogenase formation protein HypD [Vibrio sonorensis]